MSAQSPVEDPGIDRRSFEQIREIVYAESGIILRWEKATLVVGRLSKRLRALGLSSYSQYVRRLREDETKGELTFLLNAISTNVTYFFREPDHFEFIQQLLGEWVAAGQRRLRIWCAAASTGEEPYTIAMTVMEKCPPEVDCKILATDISTQALARAQQGIYQAKAVEPVPHTLKGRYFEPVLSDGVKQFAANSRLKSRLLFRHFNLVKFPYALTGPLDLVMCRNVMIYFDPPTRQQIINEFHRLLKPGGYLIVSHSESLTGLHCPFAAVRPSIYIKS